MKENLIDALNIQECLDILKNAHPQQTYYRKEPNQPKQYRNIQGHWQFYAGTDVGWVESVVNYREHDLASKFAHLDCIRAKCLKIVKDAPLFTRDELNKPEAMYNTRTGHYVVRGLHSALVECEGDYYRSTMPYHSSFYSECVYLEELKDVGTRKHIHIERIVVA